MKNKRTIGILALLLASGLILAGCDNNKGSESSGSSDPSSSDTSSSSEEEPPVPPTPVPGKYTVTFKVEGVVVQTSEVDEGSLAVYEGPTPTKAPDAYSDQYRFRSWDKDIRLPITEDTEFNALFSGYQDEMKIGDFEGLRSNSELADNGWFALGYASGGYTKQTAAAVSLSDYAAQGEKSLRFDGWGNGNDYKISREFGKDEFVGKAANAIKFTMMSPRFLTTKIIFQGSVTVGGQTQNAYFSHVINVPSNQYVDYVIPFASSGWALWGEAGKSMVEVADWVGFHQDDVINYMTSIEFFFKGNDGAGGQKYFVHLDDISFVTLADPALDTKEDLVLGEKYTGGTNTKHTMTLNISGSSATASIIDLSHPINIDGTISVTNGNQVQFKSLDDGATLTYNGKLMDGGQSIQYISSSSSDPTIASEVTEMPFMAVQTVDNFEQYAIDGTAYYQGQTNKDNRTGCRGAYYSEYYASGTYYSEFGGNGWSLLGGDGDQLKLMQDGDGHNSNQYLCLKNSESNAMRYMQWNLFDGSAERQSFRGSTLSFWAKTSGTIPSFKVTMYSQSKPVAGTVDSNMRRLEVLDAKDALISDWTHYEIALNPNLTYYGFMVTMEKNGSTTSYLYIDDVEVYTASPYAEYISPYYVPTKVTYYGKALGAVNVSMDIIDETNAHIDILGLGQSLDATYVKDDYEVTFTIEGGLTYVADISLDAKTLTFVSVSGTEGIVKTLLNGLNMTIIKYLENAEAYSETGHTSMHLDYPDETNMTGARGAYYVDLHNGGNKTSPVGGEGWQLPASEANLTLYTASKVDFDKSLAFKNNKNGEMRYMQWELYKGTAKPVTGFDSFNFFIKNRCAYNTNVTVMVYKVQQVTPETQGEAYRVTANYNLGGSQDWTRYTIKLNPNETYYGFAVMLESAGDHTTNYVNIDKVYYSNSIDDQNNYFFVNNGLELSGTLEGGKASQMNFSDDGTFEFTCAALSLDHAEGTYTLLRGGTQQTIKLHVSNSDIIAVYTIDNTGAVTLEIVSVTGDLGDSFSDGTLTGSIL